MIFAVIVDEERGAADLWKFDAWEELHRETFSPCLLPVAVWEEGRYTRKKEAARMQLANLSNAAAAPGIAYSELIVIQNRAENVARRAGLLREARENGIC